MGHCISRFKHLVSLHFSHSSINESVYLAVFALPLLRHLRIEHCSFPLIPLLNQERFASLPVETLFLKDVTSDPQTVDSITLLPPIFLATAAELTTIEVEWTPEIAAFFARHSPFDSSLFAISTQLRHFTLLMPLAESLLDDPDELYLTLIAPLIQFLETTPLITHFTVLNQLPNFFLPISILPNLKSYTGPINLFNKLPRRDLDHLELTDNLSLDQLLVLFDRLPIACPSLTSLSFICDSLVDIVPTMTTCLRRLSLMELSIICRPCAAPEAVTRILNHFPFIRSLRLYTDAIHPPFLTSTGCQPRGDSPRARLSCHRSDPSQDAFDEVSLKQLVGSHKELKEIQLRRSIVWRRCFGNDWARVEL
ncbi:hypothetical protein ONZ45_g17435 [Pleurotus djamor]|nr:hypothetical protein ONZ45_g17435 [Pleurotus djamor]